MSLPYHCRAFLEYMESHADVEEILLPEIEKAFYSVNKTHVKEDYFLEVVFSIAIPTLSLRDREFVLKFLKKALMANHPLMIYGYDSPNFDSEEDLDAAFFYTLILDKWSANVLRSELNNIALYNEGRLTEASKIDLLVLMLQYCISREQPIDDIFEIANLILYIIYKYPEMSFGIFKSAFAFSQPTIRELLKAIMSIMSKHYPDACKMLGSMKVFAKDRCPSLVSDYFAKCSLSENSGDNPHKKLFSAIIAKPDSLDKLRIFMVAYLGLLTNGFSLNSLGNGLADDIILYNSLVVTNRAFPSLLENEFKIDQRDLTENLFNQIILSHESGLLGLNEALDLKQIEIFKHIYQHLKTNQKASTNILNDLVIASIKKEESEFAAVIIPDLINLSTNQKNIEAVYELCISKGQTELIVLIDSICGSGLFFKFKKKIIEFTPLSLLEYAVDKYSLHKQEDFTDVFMSICQRYWEFDDAVIKFYRKLKPHLNVDRECGNMFCSLSSSCLLRLMRDEIGISPSGICPYRLLSIAESNLFNAEFEFGKYILNFVSLNDIKKVSVEALFKNLEISRNNDKLEMEKFLIIRFRRLDYIWGIALEYASNNSRIELVKFMTETLEVEIDEAYKQSFVLNLLRLIKEKNSLSPYYNFKRLLNWNISESTKRSAIESVDRFGHYEIYKFLLEEFNIDESTVAKIKKSECNINSFCVEFDGSGVIKFVVLSE